MVQSNPLCRLETADTAEERRIGALSNRYIYDDHDGNDGYDDQDEYVDHDNHDDHDDHDDHVDLMMMMMSRELLLFTVHTSAFTCPISPNKEMNTMAIGGGFGWVTLAKY